MQTQKIEPEYAEFVKQGLEATLTGMVQQATEIINRKISKKRARLVCPGHIVIDVSRAINPLLGYDFPKNLRELAKDRVINDYRRHGWNVDEYRGEFDFKNNAFSALLYEIYLTGKYKFSLSERVR